VLMASNDVVEFTSDSYESKTVPGCVAGDNSTETSCVITQTLSIDKDMSAPIYMYYQLDNFYQNHRRYVKSRSDVQLRNGDLFEVSGSCEPLATRSCGPSADGKKGDCAVYPCGLIAWSVFNDSFYGWNPTAPAPPANANCPDKTSCLAVRRNNADYPIKWTKEGIAWKSDKDKKFINPAATDAMPYGMYTGTPSDSKTLALPYDNYKYFKCADTSVAKASCPIEKRYADVADEEFIVWMRTSGLPDFRKLHRIINEDLKAGDLLTFYVNNVFPVTAFEGKKKIVLSTTTWIGGKNQFLGWAYIVVAILCLLLAIGFGIKQRLSPREPTTSSELEKTLNEADS